MRSLCEINESLRMRVLIVQSKTDLAILWQRHLERMGATVQRAETEAHAITLIEENGFDVIVLDVLVRDGSALAIADVAYFRSPAAKVVFVTDTTFFSDGSIFKMIPNARGCVGGDIAPSDLADMVEHYGNRSKRRVCGGVPNLAMD